MAERERLLRLRPFNMANFSGGSGYMPVYAILGALAFVPAVLLLWTGFAISLKTENGNLHYQILKRRLNRILLPICIVLFIPWAIYLGTAIYGNIFAYGLALLWCAGVPTLGIYCCMLFSAMLLNAKGKLSKGKWLLLTLGFAVLLLTAGIGIFLLLLGLGDLLDTLTYRL